MTVEAGGVPAEEQAVDAPEDSPLPLRELDAALGPVRRVVQYGMQRGARPRHVEANARRHLGRALALDLPTALREALAAVAGQLDGFDAALEPEQRERLSRAYASLARLDAVAGLPLPTPRLRPIRKPVQRDRPERPEAEPAPPVPIDEGASAPREPEPSSVEATEADAPEAEVAQPSREPSPRRFRGDLGTALADLVPTWAEAFDAQGVQTVADLLLLPPQDYEVLEPVHGAGRALPVGRVAVSGRLVQHWSVLRPDGTTERWSRLVGAGPVRLRWGAACGDAWRGTEQRVVVAGEATEDGTLVDAEPVRSDGHVARIASYAFDGIDDVVVRALVRALEPGLGRVRDPVNGEVLQSLHLPALGAALAGAHLRGEPAARRRLAFDEALLAQLGGSLPRVRRGRERGLSHAVLHGFMGKASQMQELLLDDAQQLVLEEIKRDLRRSTPMRRLVTGEVGAGKGCVALLAAAMVAEARTQVLVLSPDEAGAQERFLHSEPLLRDGGLVARLVPSPPTGSQRDAIRRGEVHVVFGAVDLLEANLEFRRLGLVVASERERWGRASLLHSGLAAPRPDLLVLSAVPAGPRVLMTAYADHDVSVLVDPQRQPARISIVRADERGEAYARLRAAVERGEQGVVVFPMVRGQDALDVRDALRVVRALEADALSGITVGLFHGAMPAEERRRVHEDFLHRRLQILVSTTRIEDGPTIPGATAVVIEQADSVDQWRLHRIVGFFSRARRQAEAVLVVGELADREAADRIERVLAAPNGFALTEALVALQGVEAAVEPGAPPLASFGWLDHEQDLDLVLASRDEVQRLLKADPSMRRGAHGELQRELVRRWSELWPDSDDEWAPPTLDEGTSAPAVGGKRRRRRRRRR